MTGQFLREVSGVKTGQWSASEVFFLMVSDVIAECAKRLFTLQRGRRLLQGVVVTTRR